MAALLVAAATRAAVADGVYVALFPTQLTVAPDSVFELDIMLSQAGSPINAYEAFVGFDAAVLTFLPQTPLSLQEGSLMTGACGETFHEFTQGMNDLHISHSLLCNGISLTGPGQLYKLLFRAPHEPQSTLVQFLPGLTFYNAGVYVTPIHSTDAVVHIGGTVPAVPATWGRIKALFAAG